MKKELVLGLVLLMFVGLSVAAPVEEFEYSPGDDYSVDLAGGESFTQEVNFSSGVDRALPLAVEASIVADETEFETGEKLKGEEFDVRVKHVFDNYELSDLVAEWWQYSRDYERLNSVYVYEVSDEARDNGSIPNHVVSNYEIENAGEKGFDKLDSYESIREADLSYDPDETPADQVQAGGDYRYEVGFMPILRNDIDSDLEDGEFVYGEGDVGLSDGLNASDYFLWRPRNSFTYEKDTQVGDWNMDVNGSKMEYRVSPEFIGVLPESENTLRVTFDSNPRIKPDNFDFSVDVRSKAGFASASESVEVENGSANVTVGSNSVSVTTENGANVTVESYDETTVAPPSGKEFVGGVGVEVRDSNQDEVEASGTVSIGYSQERIDSRGLDEDSITVRYFNESRGWTSEGVEVVDRDTEENTVKAKASHFSVYAAFAQPEAEEETEEDSVPSYAGPIEWSPPRDEQDVNNGSDTEVDDGTGDGTGNDAQEDDEGTDQDVNDTEQGQEESTDPGQGPNPGASEGPTGLFTGDPGSLAGGLAVLLVVVLAYLQYAGRIDISRGLNYFNR